MAIKRLRKDPLRSTKGSVEPKAIPETKITKPRETFKVDQLKKSKKTGPTHKRPVGRPKTGTKTYQSIRVTKETAIRINAMKNTLQLMTQDDLLNDALDIVFKSLNADERRMYAIWHDTMEGQQKNRR